MSPALRYTAEILSFSYSPLKRENKSGVIILKTNNFRELSLSLGFTFPWLP
jgi:hypothetical protein